MELNVLQLNKHATKESTVESFVSFNAFVKFLKNKITTQQGNRKESLEKILLKFEDCRESKDNITIEETVKYKELLDTVLSVVLPLSEDENEALIGFGNGLSTEVFCFTNAFYRFLAPYCKFSTALSFGNKEISLQVHKEIQYNLILKNIYGISSIQKKEWVHRITHPKTGLYQYYRLNIDSRFVEVYAKSTLPEIDLQVIKAHLASEDGFEHIQELLPLEHFLAKGFTVITLADITAQQAVVEIGKVVLNLNESNADTSYHEITRLMQALVGSSMYRFGLMPFFTINDRAAILYENFPYSIIVNACWNAGVAKEEMSTFINSFLLNPRVITYHTSLQSKDLPEAFQSALIKASVGFYSLMPVYHNSVLIGLSESATSSDSPLHDPFQLNPLKPALPYIAQLLKLYIDKFNIAISAIIKNNFTSVQLAVQWKFNEVAWHYFRNNKVEHKGIALENIIFEDVYPLYGEIDIRNSTIERNKALREDLTLQVEQLIETLTKIENQEYHAEAVLYLEKCKYWLQHLTHNIAIEESQFDGFFKNEVQPFLKSLADLPKPLLDEIDSYLDATDKQTGSFFSKRRYLEDSIQLINNTLGEYFSRFREETQTIYPCYFETFRTDGIEYDIYIGQSIAPKNPFTMQHLQKLRQWQVETMAAIAKTTFSLLPQMQYKLRTTQLLLINPGTIDITFRNDERRFDVEGAYNIRYQVIKKRIDKVNVLYTNERLTQPDKIAIVYFDDKNAEEYVGYIHQLQQQQLLLNDLEYLELEELQGVTGLKALRVGVNLQ